MPVRLTRRATLLLPALLAACGREERTDFPPLRYNYLPPLRLNVAAMTIQQRYYPSGMPPDMTPLAPVHPIEALRTMAEDRLLAAGTTGQAIFAITNASLTRQDNVITCALAVELEIDLEPGVRSGFAQAVTSREHRGHVDDLRGTLYDLTKAAVDAMNVEFEFQVRRNLQPWLISTAPAPVQQQPLDTAPPAPQPGMPPGPDMGAPPAPPGAFAAPPQTLPPMPPPQAIPPSR